MKDILYARAVIVNFIKRYESYIIFGARFVVGLTVFGFAFSIGMFRAEVAPLFSAPLAVPFMVLLAVAFAFLPATLNYILITLVVAAQLTLSLEAATFTLLVLICVIIFYVRLSPQKSYLILAIIFGFYFNVPYAVVLFAGLYLGVASILPVALGTFIYFYAPNVLRTAEYMYLTQEAANGEIDLLQLPARFVEAYTMLFEGMTANFSWVIVTFIFVMVILGIYAVSRLSIDYAKEIAIGFGGIVCIMCFVMASLVIEGFEMSTIAVVIGSIISVAAVFFVRFFDGLPNYQRTENVTFEDDDNYYYCKIVPKLAFPQTLQKKEPPKKRPRHSDTPRPSERQYPERARPERPRSEGLRPPRPRPPRPRPPQ